MKICVAQTRPITGDIERNIERHTTFIDLASSNGADLVIFPELSLTGYEPTLAKAFAMHQDDSRLDAFQTLSDTRQITLGVGIPTHKQAGICISLVLFQPHTARQTYSKKYLHPDEEAFFISRPNFPYVTVHQRNIALAICYELSVPEHAETAAQSGADIYLASVAKSADGVGQASKRLSAIANQYSMPVLMSNCVGQADGEKCAGTSSVWNSTGLLLGQLNDATEGIIIFDTNTQELIEKYYK